MKKQLFTLLALLISFSTYAQTINYLGKKLAYTKKADTIKVYIQDDKKTVLSFPGLVSFPNATDVLAAYKKALEKPTPPVVVVPPPVNSITVTPVSGKTTDLGVLTKNVIVTPGNYENVYFTYSKANDVTIDFNNARFKNSVVEVGGGNNVTLLNLILDTQKYRAFRFDFSLNNLTIKGFTFINCDDYVISSNNSKVQYNGSDATLNKGLKIINSVFDNSGTINLGNSIDVNTGEDAGIFKDVEISGNTFKNSSPGSAVSMSNVWNYDIFNNIVDNFNTINNLHNGIFLMQGNGKFHDNKLTNYQGNSIRMWLYSRGSTPYTNEIYNNICYNTRKYGAFELQQFARNIWNGKTTFANAKVYNNTGGQLNTAKDWEGQILDLYELSGTVEYYNNLGFDLKTVQYQKNVTNMINNMSGTKIIKESNNNYFPTWDKAVKDLNTLESKIPNVGAPVFIRK